MQKRLFQTSGACVFDVPSLHAWLNADISIKQADLQMLYQPLAPLDLVIASLMQAYDLSWSFKDQFSENGLFHLHPTAQSSIVCIEIPTANPMFVPEVSLSPKAIFIKLWTQESLLGKNVPFNEPCTIKISEY